MKAKEQDVNKEQGGIQFPNWKNSRAWTSQPLQIGVGTTVVYIPGVNPLFPSE